MLQRIPCAEMLDGGILVKDMLSGMSAFYAKGLLPPKICFFEYQTFTACRLERWLHWQPSLTVEDVSKYSESLKPFLQHSTPPPMTLIFNMSKTYTVYIYAVHMLYFEAMALNGRNVLHSAV